jgi:hypothetical protein
MSAPISAMPEFVFGGTTVAVTKHATDPIPRDVSEFSRKESQISVYALWVRKGKIGKGMVSAKKVDDPYNRARVTVEPKKASLSSTPLRAAFSFSPETLRAGAYRIDLMWDDLPVWRTFIRILD